MRVHHHHAAGEKEKKKADGVTGLPLLPLHMAWGSRKWGEGGGVGPFHNWHPRVDGWIDVRSYPPNNWQKGNSPS